MSESESESVLATKEVPRAISWDFSGNSATPAVVKKNVIVAITDGESVTKVTLFEELSHKMKEGKSYMVRGYSLKGGCPPYYIFITKETLFFKSSPVAAAESLRREALLLLDPPSQTIQLSEANAAGGLLTVGGVVIEVSLSYF